MVDVLIIGAGITGLYAASRLKEHNISFCILDKRDVTGGIWSAYANTTSQVNSSEGSYRLIEKTTRTNRDHSFAREILGDIAELTDSLSGHIHLNSEVKRIQRTGRWYRVTVEKEGGTSVIPARGVILAINDRVGEPRLISWNNENRFQGEIVSGISDQAIETDWKDKHVVVVGMGAFAIEKARTALEAGAKHVTVVCRRHGTVCPKIIDYLNFATPYDENFTHDKKSNLRNMLLWKKLYDLSGATQPECWPKKVKHTGHTISVSDLWFIGHHLKKINTVRGTISDIQEKGVLTDTGEFIDADIIVNCVGFTRNSDLIKDLCDYRKTYTNNYLDKDFMYLADAYIDDDAFNSFFGSSVLEMVKFYMGVYIRFFDNTDYDVMISAPGIEQIPVTERAWSTYIKGAEHLLEAYPEIRELAQKQVAERTSNFLESHDLETYIAQNKREWIETHSLLAGRPMKEEECLPFVFQKLLK